MVLGWWKGQTLMTKLGVVMAGAFIGKAVLFAKVYQMDTEKADEDHLKALEHYNTVRAQAIARRER